jgi:hypothetical protein
MSNRRRMTVLKRKAKMVRTATRRMAAAIRRQSR